MKETTDAVSFVHMAHGTREEYHFLEAQFNAHVDAGIADRVLEELAKLRGPKLGYQVDRYEHSLQTATRALRDGEGEQTVVCALLHDVGDLLAPRNHDAFAADLLRPYVSERDAWVVEKHGLFQGYYYFHHFDGDRNARDRYQSHPFYDDCVRFCERWDQKSFDPAYDTLPIEHFEPMVRRVFEQTPWQGAPATQP